MQLVLVCSTDMTQSTYKLWNQGIKHTDNTETHTGQCHVARRQVLCQHLHGYFFKTEIITVEYVFTKNSQSL